MKQFTTLKVGYSSGIYGCSAEYFTTIVIDGDKHSTFCFYGMYGAEERIAGALKNLGYTEFYTPSVYGKVTKKDVWKGCHSEYTTLEDIKTLEFHN